MSDKETAQWMREAAESIALAALRCRTFQMPTRIAEIIAAHCPVAVECRAPAPQPPMDRLPLLVDAVQKFLKHDGGPGSEDYNASEIYHARRSMQAAFGFRCPRCGETMPPLYDENCTDYRAATPQVTPELELEQEADSRWLAEFTRFPGVAAYGPSKEGAIRNAAKVLIESEQASPTPDDDPDIRWYGDSCWEKKGEMLVRRADLEGHSSASAPKGTK